MTDGCDCGKNDVILHFWILKLTRRLRMRTSICLVSLCTLFFQCSSLKFKINGNSIINNKLANCILSSSLIFSTSSIVFSPPAFTEIAVADIRAQQKRTYFRFIPKLQEGMNFYSNDLKRAIDSDNWDVVSKFYEEYVSKYNGNDPTQIDATDTYVNVHLYRPMIVFSGSFAERGTSPKQKTLLELEQKLEKTLGELEGCVKDRKEDGFFGATIKMPTGAKRKEQAIRAWTDGKKIINDYINVANDGLMLELNKIKTI